MIIETSRQGRLGVSGSEANKGHTARSEVERLKGNSIVNPDFVANADNEAKTETETEAEKLETKKPSCTIRGLILWRLCLWTRAAVVANICRHQTGGRRRR